MGTPARAPGAAAGAGGRAERGLAVLPAAAAPGAARRGAGSGAPAAALGVGRRPLAAVALAAGGCCSAAAVACSRRRAAVPRGAVWLDPEPRAVHQLQCFLTTRGLP